MLLLRKTFLNCLQIVLEVLILRNVSLELRKGIIGKENYQLGDCEMAGLAHGIL